MPSTHPRLKTLPADLFAGLQSFRELEERISALPNGSLLRGDALEVFVEAHLLTSPLFQVAELWLVNQIPLSVRRRLKLGNNNKGIDGVYRARDGTLTPYQVKFREDRWQVGVGDTASFFMLTEGLGQRMLISNSDRYSNDVRNRGNLQIVSGLYFDELAADDFTRVHSWLHNKPTQLGQVFTSLQKHLHEEVA
jgi:predicted helicase